jgi:hypothetical protein
VLILQSKGIPHTIHRGEIHILEHLYKVDALSNLLVRNFFRFENSLIQAKRFTKSGQTRVGGGFPPALIITVANPYLKANFKNIEVYKQFFHTPA